MGFIYKSKTIYFLILMEKFIKNPLYQGIAIFAILLIVAAWMFDSYHNSKKDFYGLLPAKIATGTAAI